jgi:tetratricopeptide (TPR) repeat protein
MEKVINLVKQGETKQALKRLKILVDTDNQSRVILLLARFNAHQKMINEGTQDLDNKIINQINKEILLICEECGGVYTTQKFPLPPILDNLPLDAEGYLLGRKAALEQLHTSLQSKNILTLVNGMGGIGKSTLASFYANFPKYRATYQHCYWVSVSDLTGEVKQALINAFAEALALYKMPEKAQLVKIQTHLSSLQGQTLLILDNANDKKKVTEALDFLRKCKIKVLFTSRANMSNIPAQALEKLLPEDAFTLFTHYFPAAKEMPETPQLLQNIDYHTLLTEFMAKSLAHNPVLSLQDLVEITQQQNFTDELLAYTQFTSYHTHTHDNPDAEIQPAAYLLQIFPIQNLNEKEQQILRYFSILPGEWIEMEMLLQLFAADQEKATRLQLGKVLQSLHEKGWLQKSPTNAFACHILLQHLLRQQLQPNAENCELLLVSLYKETIFDSDTNKLKLVPYLSLIIASLTWIKDETKLIADIYYNGATIFQTISKYKEALSYDKKHIAINKEKLSSEHLDLAKSYISISNTYYYLKEYQESLKYAFKALHIRENKDSSDYSEIATSYNNIGVIYKALSNISKSVEYKFKALNIREKMLHPEHSDLANSYNNIAVDYQQLKDYQKALFYGLKALSIQEKKADTEHPHLAIFYKTIALTYYYLTDYTTAYSYIQKAVSIWTKVLPEEHPDIQVALNAKAMIEQAMRKK